MRRLGLPCVLLIALVLCNCSGENPPQPTCRESSMVFPEPDKNAVSNFESGHAERLKQETDSGASFVLRCHYVTDDASVETKPVPSPFVDAVDRPGNLVLMTGHAEDGLFVPDQIASYRNGDPGKKRKDYPLSREAMEEVCVAAIASQVPSTVGKPKPYLWMMTAQTRENRGRWEKGFPIRFLDDQKVLVVFGDSISDNGNLYFLVASRLLGLYTLPVPPYFFGLFTNKYVWNYYWTMPRSRIPAPYSSGIPRVALLNLAYAGMLSGPDVTAILPPARDVGAYLAFVVQHVLCGDAYTMVDNYIRDYAEGRIEDPDNTVFVLFVGANDFDQFIYFENEVQGLLDDPAGPFGYRTVADLGVNDHMASVQRLIDAGARNISIIGVPNLGSTPTILINKAYLKKDRSYTKDEKHYLMATKLTEATAYFNARMADEFQQIQCRNPGVNLVLYPVERTFHDMFNGKLPGTDQDFDYGIKYTGLEKTLYPPAGTAGEPLTLFARCMDGDYYAPCDPKDPDCVCPIANRAPFWDPEHPTSFTHCWIGYFMHKSLFETGMIPTAPLAIADQKAFCEAMNP